jgi:hypothetical protein
VFSLLHIVQTGSGTHPASYPIGNGGGRFVKLTNYLPLVLRSRMVEVLIKERDNSTFSTFQVEQTEGTRMSSTGESQLSSQLFKGQKLV